jgi:hypothetical protein
MKKRMTLCQSLRLRKFYRSPADDIELLKQAMGSEKLQWSNDLNLNLSFHLNRVPKQIVSRFLFPDIIVRQSDSIFRTVCDRGMTIGKI